ncbi:MAG: hypothetical protein N3B21_15105 [Clostridia bacterium]|nr:hypothetical protein [Clostridia bacterium]
MLNFNSCTESGVCLRSDLIFQFETMDAEDIKVYIRDLMLPTLESHYQNLKPYLKGYPRKHIYSIKKLLVDLVESDSAIRISKQSNDSSAEPTFFQSSFSMMECLNLVYYLAVIFKNKVKKDETFTATLVILNSLIRETKLLQKDFQDLIESQFSPLQAQDGE